MVNVLQSRLINDNLGALSNVYNNNSYTNPDPVSRDPMVENEDGTYTIPTYERTVIDIPDDYDWTQYGEAGNALRYFNQIRTGEITYEPADDKIDVEALTETDPNAPPLTDEAEMIKQELIGTAKQLAAGVGAQIGRAYAATGEMGSALDAYTSQDEFKDFLFPTGDGATAKVEFSPLSDNAEIAKFDAIINKKPETQTDLAIQEQAKADKKSFLANADTGPTGYVAGLKDRGSLGLFGRDQTAAGRANLYGGVGAGVATIAANLIAGKNLKESVKTGAKVGVGTIVGTTIGGPIGGLIGGLLGGRVICNELMRQGIMTRKQVVLDYKFTEDYLTPQHVAGYHVWAVWMVKQMRKGRLVNFWTHVAGHRANEIAYIYGKRDKPDYLGKMYRKILEPICWSIGFFCQKTDWTVLYKEKEI